MSTSRPIRKIVFPAAGLGTRILPATAVLPKELIPIIDKPVIQYGVEEAVASELIQIILVTSPGKAIVKDHFSPHLALEKRLEQRGKARLLDSLRAVVSQIHLSTVIQHEPLGLGHAVLISRELVGDEPFAVLLSDDVIDATPPALRQMLALYAQVNSPVLLVERVPSGTVDRYGIIDGEPLGHGIYQVKDLVEKPALADAPSDLAIIGRYLLTPDIYPALQATGQKSSGEIQLTDGLRRLLRHRPGYALELDGIRHDTGNKVGYLQAILYFAARHPDCADILQTFVQTSQSPEATG